MSSRTPFAEALVGRDELSSEAVRVQFVTGAAHAAEVGTRKRYSEVGRRERRKSERMAFRWMERQSKGLMGKARWSSLRLGPKLGRMLRLTSSGNMDILIQVWVWVR